jgi:hypothetical protein
LENLRQTKTIGAPLDAAVKIFVPSEIDNDGNIQAPTGELAQCLIHNAAQLKDLLIVSSADVVVGPAADEFIREHPDVIPNGAVDTIESLGNLAVLAQHAPGRKCQRCWKYFDDDSDNDLDPRCPPSCRPDSHQTSRANESRDASKEKLRVAPIFLVILNGVCEVKNPENILGAMRGILRCAQNDRMGVVRG